MPPAATLLQEAAETAANLAAVIQELTTKPIRQEYTDEAAFAEINDFAEALGNYVTGTEAYRQGEWLDRWRGVRTAS